MLSKEEIENSFIRIETICKKEVCLFNQPIIEGNLNQIKRYIIQLESDKQKLIEKLEERIKAVDKCYNELLTDVGGIKIINVTGLTKKEKEEVINKRNCLLVQKHCYVEILSILKGKKKEAE